MVVKTRRQSAAAISSSAETSASVTPLVSPRTHAQRYSEFKESWDELPSASPEEGLRNGIVFLNEVSEKPELADEFMLDSFSKFLRQTCCTSQRQEKVQALAIRSLVDFSLKHAVSSLIAARLVQTCMLKQEQQLLIDLARKAEYSHLVLETVLHSETCATDLVLGLVEILEIKEATKFANAYLSQLKSDQYALFVKEVCISAGRPQHAVTALFIVQIVTLLVLRGLSASEATASACGTIACIIAQHLPLLSSDESKKERILPCSLFVKSDKNTLRSCEDCEDEGKVLFGQTTLDKIGFFKCGLCLNFFLSACPHCATCPVSVQKQGVLSKLCWGCGYRLIAGCGDENELDEKIVGIGLVLSSPYLDVDAKKFLRNHISREAWLGKADLRINEQIDSSFVPSEEFVFSILAKLVLVDRFTLIRAHLAKAVMATPFLSPSTIKTLSILATSSSSSSLSSCLIQTCVLREYLDSVLQSIDASNARLVNSVLELILHLGMKVFESNAEILSFLRENKVGLSSKKLVFKILLTLYSESSIEAIAEYLSVDELDQSDCISLLEETCEYLIRRGIPDLILSFVQSLQWPLVDEFERLIPAETMAFLVSFSSNKFDLSRRLRLVSSIIRKPPKGDLTILGNPLIGIIASSINETEVTLACEVLVKLIPAIPKNYEKKSKLGEIVLSKLVPLILSGSSGAVRAAANLLVVSLDHILGKKEEILNPLIEKFEPDLKNGDIRACWVLGTFPAATAVVDFIVNHCPEEALEGVIVVLGFPGCLDHLFANEKTIDVFRKGLTLFPAKTLNTMCAIMTGSSHPVKAKREERPDGGVWCREFGELSPAIESVLMASSGPLALLALKTIHFMDQLGVVNRRTLPPLLLLRHVLSDRTDCEESQDDSTDVTTVSFRMFSKFFDPKLKHALLPRILAELRPLIPSHLRLSNTGNVINTALRLSQLFFVPSALVKKQDMKSTLHGIVDQLITENGSSESFSKLLVLSAVAGASALAHDDRYVFVEKLDARISLAIDPRPLEFLQSEIKNLSKQKTTSFFQLLLQVSHKYFSHDDETPHPEACKKRRRLSADKELQQPRRKRTRKTPAYDDDDDEEYTDGLTQEEPDEEFPSSFN